MATDNTRTDFLKETEGLEPNKLAELYLQTLNIKHGKRFPFSEMAEDLAFLSTKRKEVLSEQKTFSDKIASDLENVI